MQFAPKLFAAKNGQVMVMRTIQEGDEQLLHNFIMQAVIETEFLSMSVKDQDQMSVEKQQERIKRYMSSDNSICLVVETDKKIIGSASIKWSNKFKFQHRAEVGVAILKDYWNLGIGSAFFDELLRIAGRNGKTQVDLSFVEGNWRARMLYEKKGFKIVARIPDIYMMSDGTLRDQYYMIKYL